MYIVQMYNKKVIREMLRGLFCFLIWCVCDVFLCISDCILYFCFVLEVGVWGVSEYFYSGVLISNLFLRNSVLFVGYLWNWVVVLE